MTIEPEDYIEPNCPLQGCSCGHPHGNDHCSGHIPMDEIIARSDDLFNQNNSKELGEHLRFWRAKAQELGDQAGELSMLSELMGHYRMAGERERGLAAVREGFALMKEMGVSGSVSAGTILINGATALQAFGFIDEALEHYAEAFRCYGNHLDPNDWRFAGLLNNMAAAYSGKADFERAKAYYLKALQVLEHCGNLMDSAVTCVNLAQLEHGQDPDSPEIDVFLDRAKDFFDSPEAEFNGYYAHTCLKCASTFGFFGRKEYEADLKCRADALYAAD